MEPSMVTDLKPITTAAPVTLIMLHQPDTACEPAAAKTIPLQCKIPEPANPNKTTPRLVTTPAKSLLRQNQSVTKCSNLPVEPDVTSSNNKSLLKHKIEPLHKTTGTLILPKKNASLLKPVIFPQTNSEPGTAKTVAQPHLRSVTVKAKSLLKRAKSGPKARKSLLKPVITSQDKKSLLNQKITLSDKTHVNSEILPKKNASLLKSAIVQEMNSMPTKTVAQPTPRSVTVNTNSLLKQAKSVCQSKNSPLDPVITPSDNELFLNHVIRPKRKRHIVKPQTTPPNNNCVNLVSNSNSPSPAIVQEMHSMPTKTVTQPTPRSVTVNTNSLLAKSMSKCQNSPLNSVITPSDKELFLNHIIRPKRKRHEVKPETAPPNKNPVNLLVTSNSNVSSPKPATVPYSKGPVSGSRNTQNVTTVRPAKSLLKPDIPHNNLPTSSCGVNLEDHDYVANHGVTLFDSKPEKGKRKVFPGDITLDDFKTTQRAKQNLAILKNTLAKAKEKLHSRHRRASSAIGKVIELKRLLWNLKSKNLVTEEGYYRLEISVDRTLTILKDNFLMNPLCEMRR